MSTFFLFGNLKSGLSETLQVCILTFISDKGERENFIFLWLFPLRLAVQFLPRSQERVYARNFACLAHCTYGMPFCVFSGPPSQPLLRVAQLSLVQTCWDNASILFDMAAHGKDGVKVNFPRSLVGLTCIPHLLEHLLSELGDHLRLF